jgi:hypothetical protein
MAVHTDGLMCLVVDVPGETREQFEAVMAHLARSGPVPPSEARLLVSGERDGGWQTVSVWESEAAMQRFFEDRLGPAYRDAGVTVDASRRETFAVHTIVGVAETAR